jgi:hypothetical protein
LVVVGVSSLDGSAVKCTADNTSSSIYAAHWSRPSSIVAAVVKISCTWVHGYSQI